MWVYVVDNVAILIHAKLHAPSDHHRQPGQQAHATNNHDGEKKSFSVMGKLGKYPNLWWIVVTLIPLHWHFSLGDTRLELGWDTEEEKLPNLAKTFKWSL